MIAALPARARMALARPEARGFVISFAPTMAALVFQLGVFVLLGRALGAAQFGQISAALALTVVLVEVVGLGSGDILVRAVSRRPADFPGYYASALRIGALTLPPTAALGWLLARYVLHVAIGAAPLAALMVLEIGAARVAATAESVAVAHRDIVRASTVRLGWAMARFALAAVVLGVLHLHDVNTWIWCTSVQSLLTAAAFLVVTTRAYGRPAGHIPKGEVGTGVLFAVNQSSRAAQGNFDRAFMAMAATGAVIGAYAAGSRLVQLGLFPMQILNRMLYPRFFALGHEGGLAATRRYAVRCSPAAVGVGLFGAAAVACAALLAPTLLGPSFARTTPITLVLACALPLMALQYPAADALTGAGRQGLRTVVFAITALLFSVGLAVGAGLAGLWGVVTAFVLGHLVLAMVLWGLLFIVRDIPAPALSAASASLPAPPSPSPPASPVAAAVEAAAPRGRVADGGRASRELKYRPDIDGLRAVAVGSVVLFHAGVPGFSGGFVGVDVFFVISGYLITGIIAREAKEGRFSVAGFYERRVRRIFPALFAMLAVVAAVASFLLLPTDYNEFGESVGATALFASNLFFWVKSGYFDATADLKPLLHTWSLAVEEQYYLVLPPLMAFLVMRVRRWRAVVAILAALSFALACWQVAQAPTAAFYSPLSRAWELLIGALIAIGGVPPIRRPDLREAAAALGLVLVLIAVFTYAPSTPFPGFAALLPCLGAALMIHADGEAPTGTGRMLSLPPMIGLGLISYSLYLWHWPVLVFARYVLERPLTGWESLAAVGLGVLLAIQSWRWIERPFRRGKAGRVRLFGVALLLMGLAVGFAGAAHLLRGAPQRFPSAVRRLAAAEDDINPDRAACDRPPPARLRAGGACVRGDLAAAGPTFALLGDSFADAMMPGVAQAAREHHAKGLMLTYSGCLPLLDIDQGEPACQRFLRAAVDRIRATPSIDKVILVSRWTADVTGVRYGAWTQSLPLSDAQAPGRTTVHNPQVVERGLQRLAAALAPRRLYLVSGLAEQAVDVPRFAALASWLHPVAPFGVPRAVYEARQAPVRAMLAATAPGAKITVLDAAPYVCGPSFCPALRDGRVLYADDNHLSRTGAVSIRALLDPIWPDGSSPPDSQLADLRVAPGPALRQVTDGRASLHEDNK